jgi:hypothetical protein
MSKENLFSSPEEVYKNLIFEKKKLMRKTLKLSNYVKEYENVLNRKIKNCKESCEFYLKSKSDYTRRNYQNAKKEVFEDVRSLTDSIKKIIKKLKKSFHKENIYLKRVSPPKVSNLEYNDNSLSEGENNSSSEEEKDVEPENININEIIRNQFSASESVRNQRISENQQNSNIQSISINEINRNIIIDSQQDNIVLDETLSRNLPRTITLEKYDTNSADFKRKIGEKLVYKKIERFSDNNDLNTGRV